MVQLAFSIWQHSLEISLCQQFEIHLVFYGRAVFHQSSIDGHLLLFHVIAITNETAGSILLRLCAVCVEAGVG